MFGRVIAVAAMGLALALATPASSQERGLSLVAIPGMFGMEATGCGRPSGADPAFDSAAVDPRACVYLSEATRTTLGQQFAQGVSGAFGNVLVDARDAIQAGQSRDLALTQTAFVSLHLTRVKVWTYPKLNGVVAAQTQLSLRMLVTNAATGEVMFVKDVSRDFGADYVNARIDAMIGEQIATQLPVAVNELVAAAAAEFDPRPVLAQVVGRAGDDYVVDAGRARGVREGDLFDGDVEVVFSDADYAVVRPLLGDLAIGRSLRREVAQPISALERPSLLAIIAHAPKGMGRNEMLSLVEGRLAASGFAVAPINPNFLQIRDQAFGATGVRARQRPLPDYFLRVSIDVLDPTEGPNTRNLVDGELQRLQEAWVFLEVVDRSGRVVFATTGKGRIEDRVFGEMSFAPEQRREPAIGSAISVAIQALASGFNPAPLRLAVRAEGEGVRVVDPGGALTQGVDAEILRRVGRMRGIEGDVWRPVGGVEVTSVDAAGAVARSTEVNALDVRSGDVLAYRASATSQSRRRFAPCPASSAYADIDWRSDTRQELYPLFALNGFAGGFRGPVFIPGFDALVRRELGQQFEDIDTLGAARPVSADVCFQPVHSAIFKREDRTRSTVSFDLNRRWRTYDLIMGYRLFQADQRVGGTGVQEEMRGQEVAVVSGPEQDERALQMDLASRAAELSRRAASELAPPQ